VADELLVVPTNNGEDHKTPHRTTTLFDYKGEELAEIARHPDITVKNDVDANRATRDQLDDLSMEELMDIFEEAGRIFAEEPLGPDDITPEEYAETVSKARGLPISSVEDAIETIEYSFKNMDESLRSQSPDGTLDVFDTNTYETAAGAEVNWIPKGNTGVLGPGNHPAVYLIPFMAYGAKMPVTIRPSDDEPFTSARMVDALYEAGAPEGSIYFLPGDREVGDKLLESSDAGIAFGTESLEEKYAEEQDVSVYGPGNSKIFVDKSRIDDDDVFDMLEEAMMRDAGRGCINMSQVITNGDSEELAEGLAERVADVEVKDPLDEEAVIGAIPHRYVEEGTIEAFDSFIEANREAGAFDVTAGLRDNNRIIEHDGAQYMLPTVIQVEDGDYEHPLFTELPFQYASVLEVSDDEELYEAFDGSLSVGLLTEDEEIREMAQMHPGTSKTYIEDVTTNIRMTEPHEGYLLDKLYQKKSFRNGDQEPAESETGYVQRLFRIVGTLFCKRLLIE